MLWRPRRHVVTDDDLQPRDFVALLDQPDKGAGASVTEDSWDRSGVYVLAALLLPLLRRAPHRVELDVPFRRAWMTAARRLGQRRLSSRSTRCGGRLRQCLNVAVYVSDVARQRYRTATVENEAAPGRPNPCAAADGGVAGADRSPTDGSATSGGDRSAGGGASGSPSARGSPAGSSVSSPARP